MSKKVAIDGYRYTDGQTLAMKSKKTQTRNHKLVLLPLIIVISLACLCQYDPYAHQYSTKEPNPDEITGTYELKEQTMIAGGLDFLQERSATIEIKDDGTYEAVNFPDWANMGETGDNLPELISETGTWRVSEVGTVSGENGTIGVWGIRFSGIGAAHLTNNESPHGLIFSYGDPDAGNVMIYEK